MDERSGKSYNEDSFLENIARNLGRNRLTEKPERPDDGPNPLGGVFSGLAQDELLEKLKNQCIYIHTDLIETTRTGLPGAVRDAIERNEAQSVITWRDPRFEEFGLRQAFEEGAYDCVAWDSDDREESIASAERADVGITFSDMTLAESATVVLFSDEGKGRSVSLLPKTYIAIIPKSTIVPRMTQAAIEIDRRIAAGETVASCVNFISGPSNSADIEMSLVVGVHGPVKATYIVVDDA